MESCTRREIIDTLGSMKAIIVEELILRILFLIVNLTPIYGCIVVLSELIKGAKGQMSLNVTVLSAVLNMIVLVLIAIGLYLFGKKLGKLPFKLAFFILFLSEKHIEYMTKHTGIELNPSKLELYSYVEHTDCNSTRMIKVLNIPKRYRVSDVTDVKYISYKLKNGNTVYVNPYEDVGMEDFDW